jgi:serine/threonine protein phosphatase 1
MIKTYSKNTKGRDFVVGDIHGCFTALQTALDRIGFDEVNDRLFSVGDLVDRGRESESSLEWLAKPWFHAVTGNHELMAIMYASGELDAPMYAMNGGAWFIGKTPAEREEYVHAFAFMPTAIELETDEGLIGIIHAECPVQDWRDLPEALAGEHGEAFANMCAWSRDRITHRNTDEVRGVRAVICGHTPLKRAVTLGNVYFIDTAAVFPGGKLTILDAATLQEAA